MCTGLDKEKSFEKIRSFNSCQCTKWLKKGKPPDKVSEEIPWNKICVYLIGL